MVLNGAWRDKIGGVVKQGDQLFEVSPLKELVATIHVDERDADLLNFASGQTSLRNRVSPHPE